MANFKIGVPQHVRDELAKDRANINLEISKGDLPNYHTFVSNLMKGMQTPAEELHHATTGMAGEAGELLDISKKIWIYNKTLDLAHLIEELGDLRFYYQSALNMIGLTDEDIRTQNMIKLRKRYADGKYSDAQAQARADKQPLSATGAKGTEPPVARKFMGQPAAPTPVPLTGDNAPDKVTPDTTLSDLARKEGIPVARDIALQERMDAGDPDNIGERS